MKPLMLVSSVLGTAFIAVIISLLLQTNTPLTQFSRADTSSTVECPMNTSLYVHEINSEGQEVPFSLDKNPSTDVLAWSISDGLNPSDQPLYFNAIPLLEYNVTSKLLSFSLLPRVIDTYQKGDTTFLTLNYPKETYSIIKQEIETCSSPKHQDLCTSTEDSTELNDSIETIRNITLDCNMTLHAGWVVQKHPHMNIQAQSAAPSIDQCDLNGDGACNTFDLFIVLDNYGKEAPNLPGDLNNDNTVNALDYTLMTSRISLL